MQKQQGSENAVAEDDRMEVYVWSIAEEKQNIAILSLHSSVSAGIALDLFSFFSIWLMQTQLILKKWSQFVILLMNFLQIPNYFKLVAHPVTTEIQERYSFPTAISQNISISWVILLLSYRHTVLFDIIPKPLIPLIRS